MSNQKTRQEVVCFDGTRDFSMWKIKMMAHFEVPGLKYVILSDDFEMTIDEVKTKIQLTEADLVEVKVSESKVIIDPAKLEKDERVQDIIIVNISDLVLRKIKHCTTAASQWALLDRLYMSKSLPNRIFVQSQFYTFKCEASKATDVNVDDFLKIVAEMGSLDVNVSDEIQAIVFLNALPTSFDQLKHTLKYRKESLCLEEVISTAKSREREISENNRGVHLSSDSKKINLDM